MEKGIVSHKLPNLRDFHENNAFYSNPHEVAASIDSIADEGAKAITQRVLVTAVSMIFEYTIFMLSYRPKMYLSKIKQSFNNIIGKGGHHRSNLD